MNITYTFVSRCGSGGHTTLDIAINAGAPERVTYSTDELRVPLNSYTEDEIRFAKLIVLKAHLAGKTRPQIVAEFATGPVAVTI